MILTSTSAETSGTSVEVYIANTDKLAVGDDGEMMIYIRVMPFWEIHGHLQEYLECLVLRNRSDPTKDKYVMVMGGGMSMKRGIGSNVFVIDLDDDSKYWKNIKSN